MHCVICNKKIADTAKFCPYCGSKVESMKEPVSEKNQESVTEQAEVSATDAELRKTETIHRMGTISESAKTETPKTTVTDNDSKNEFALKIGFLILAGMCGVLAFQSLLNAIDAFSYSALSGLGGLLGMACYIGMVAILVIILFTEKKEKVKTYFMVLVGIAAAILLGEILRFVFNFFQSLGGYYFSWSYLLHNLATLFITLLSMLTVVGVPYCLLLLAEKAPDFSCDIAKLNSKFADSALNFGANNYQQTASENQRTYNNQQTGNAPRPNMPMPLKTNRRLLGYILLSILTCGIYSYYFIYTIARDVNIACRGDGKSTGGLLKFILLSIVTCGIYSWWWEYSLGNRLAENAPRYGMSFSENGTTVLMWLLFGMFLCGIGPFIAMSIIIKNTNSICMAYNRQNGLI